jgi:hypothetical protein
MITAKISNLNVLTMAQQSLSSHADDAMVKASKTVILLQSIIKAKLAEILGQKAKHFDVSVDSGAGGMKVCVKSTDMVGNFIYEGTIAHDIISDTAMPLSNGNFAQRVSHPGTESMKKDIQTAVNLAVAEVRGMI